VEKYYEESRWKFDWIGHIFRGGDCLLNRAIEGKLEQMIEGQEDKGKQLLGDFKEKKGH
jgi:hypothetical protein